MYDLPKLNWKEINTSNRSITNGETETTEVKKTFHGQWDGSVGEGSTTHIREQRELPKSKSKQINCWVLQEFQKQTPKFPKLRDRKIANYFYKASTRKKKHLKTIFLMDICGDFSLPHHCNVGSRFIIQCLLCCYILSVLKEWPSRCIHLNT